MAVVCPALTPSPSAPSMLLHGLPRAGSPGPVPERNYNLPICLAEQGQGAVPAGLRLAVSEILLSVPPATLRSPLSPPTGCRGRGAPCRLAMAESSYQAVKDFRLRYLRGCFSSSRSIPRDNLSSILPPAYALLIFPHPPTFWLVHQPFLGLVDTVRFSSPANAVLRDV